MTFPIYGIIKHVPNHQPNRYSDISGHMQIFGCPLTRDFNNPGLPSSLTPGLYLGGMVSNHEVQTSGTFIKVPVDISKIGWTSPNLA